MNKHPDDSATSLEVEESTFQLENPSPSDPMVQLQVPVSLPPGKLGFPGGHWVMELSKQTDARSLLNGRIGAKGIKTVMDWT